MATRYSQDVKTNIKELTLESAQSLYEWITYCVNAYNKNISPKFEVRYKRGDISCKTDNYQEFLRDTYGLIIIISEIHISYYDIDLSFLINPTLDTDSRPYQKYVEITIFSKDIDSILAIVPSLKHIISKEKIKVPEQIQQLPEITINVGGDLTMAGSSIGSGNEVHNGQHVSATTKKDTIQEETSFWKGIKQQLVANWIWWLLGLIGATIIGWLGYVNL